MRTLAPSVLGCLVVVAGLANACGGTQAAAPESAPQPAAPTATVKFFGNPPPVDQSARTGTQNAPQSFTAAPSPKALKTALRTKWATNVGKTTPRTTMALVAGRIVIGTHGASLTAQGESGDAVHVLDAKTGEERATIRSPDGAGVEGIAAHDEDVFFSTGRGQVVRASLAGVVRWSVNAGGSVPAAPALADLDGDGSIDVVVGTGSGHVVALDGRKGKKLWDRHLSVDATGGRGVEGGVSIADLDKDGKEEVVAGGGDGTLSVLRGRDGEMVWSTKSDAPILAAPTLVDVDAHGGLEVLASWSNGKVGIFDGKSGTVLWTAHVEQDDGQPDGSVANAVILPGGRVGVVVAATTRWGKNDGLVVLSETERLFRSREGRVTATPVVVRLDPASTPDAIVGTTSGDVVAIDASGGRTFLASMGAPIEASPMIADVDSDGVRDLLVAASDGLLTCFSTGVAEPPLVARLRGSSPDNRGIAPDANLGWTFARGRDGARLLEERATPRR